MGNLFDLLIDLDKNLFFLINSKAGIHESIDSLLVIVAGDYLVPVMLSLGLIFYGSMKRQSIRLWKCVKGYLLLSVLYWVLVF